MSTKEIDDLQEELEKSRAAIRRLKKESSVLKKAIWDMLNYAQMFVVILDSQMIIRLINWSLATELGFENERDAIGHCWTEFLPEDVSLYIQNVHKKLAFNKEDTSLREITNDIQTLSGERLTVKWFNVPVNSNYHMTFSMGLKLSQLNIEVATSISEDSIRAYYRDIIEKDRTMIQSLKDVVLKGFDSTDVCKLEDIK